MMSLFKRVRKVLPFLLPAQVLFGFMLLFFPGSLFAGSPNDSSSGPSMTSSRTGPEDSSAFSFAGLVEPSESLRILLQPGESVNEIFIKEGETVIQGQALAELSNNTLTNAKFDLLQKQNQISKERQQVDIAALEVTMKERQLHRINKQISEETRLTSQVEGYISTVSNQLEEQKFIVTGELEILRTKLAKMTKAAEQMDALQAILTAQLAELENSLKNLLITAPFPGEIVFLAPDPPRTPPGGVIAELWGNRFYKVRGRVMQHQIEQITIGEHVEVSLDFSREPPLKGTVTAIQQSRVAPDNRGGYPTFDVIVDIADTAQWIRPGMMVSMKKS